MAAQSPRVANSLSHREQEQMEDSGGLGQTSIAQTRSACQGGPHRNRAMSSTESLQLSSQTGWHKGGIPQGHKACRWGASSLVTVRRELKVKNLTLGQQLEPCLLPRLYLSTGMESNSVQS